MTQRRSACPHATAGLRLLLNEFSNGSREVCERLYARNVVTPRLKGLIGRIELTPNEIRDAVSDPVAMPDVDADFHDRSGRGEARPTLNPSPALVELAFINEN